MSTHRVPVTFIREVLSHPNADRLEVVKIYDWLVVARKGEFKPQDAVVYIPVDSILSQELEQVLFPEGSKITLAKHRIRSIKIRGHISQGMAVKLKSLQSLGYAIPSTDEFDAAQTLGVTKYEPPAADVPRGLQAKKARRDNPNFPKYTDIENFKYYDRNLAEGELVYVSEKLHGTSFRAGWFKNEPTVWWKKALKFFHLLPEWQFCWGSRQVQIQCKLYHKGYYTEDVYTKIVKQYDLKNRLPKGIAIYGEIVGDGIQKGYTYGCGKGEHKLYVYDVLRDGKYLDYDFSPESDDTEVFSAPYPATFKEAMEFLRLPTVPLLHAGPYSRTLVDKLRDGDSTIPGQKVREGIVIKPIKDTTASFGRKVLKYISDAYYMNQENTDFH